MAAVKDTGWALEYVSDEIRADREVVLVAVKDTGYALRWASEALKLIK